MREPLVVFATNLTGDVDAGLALATRLARERSATLGILHVLPLIAGDGEAMLHAATDLAGRASERRLETLAPTDPSVPFVRAHEVGDPEACIAAFVEHTQAELLVMEAPPKAWYRRAFGGRLIERLRQRCACPIVTYRPGARPARVGRPPVAPAIPESVSEEVLTTLLNARVGALLSWMRNQQRACVDVAAQSSVAHAVASLIRAPSGSGVFVERMATLLRVELTEYQRAWRALGVTILTPAGPLMQIGGAARRSAAYEMFLERVRQHGSAVSVPLQADDDASDLCLVLAGATVPGVPEATLLFAFDARRDFLRILAQPGPCPSAETYAFDQDGVMLSNSRFPDQLRRVGILPKHCGVQTPTRVRVCDPGGNLLRGQGALAPSLPLTRSAATAIAGRDGHDFTGYRDYRGVEVVGVWRWLPEFGFGVTAEVDLEAA